jgi:NTE family protein
LAVRASSSVPGIFVPVKISDKILVDGAASCPVPVEEVKNMGAEVVLAVNLYNIKSDGEFGEKNITLKQTTWRSAIIGLNTLSDYCARGADIVIDPFLNKYSDIKKYFSPKYDNKEAIAIGEAEAEKIIPSLKKKLGL